MAIATVTSADGSSIAYETCRLGRPLITVCGATCDRARMRPTARELGRHLARSTTTGAVAASGDTLPYAIEREVQDIAALIDAVGGSAAHLYGHSSGAGLVLHAVAAGLPVERFVVQDPPRSPDDPG